LRVKNIHLLFRERINKEMRKRTLHNNEIPQTKRKIFDTAKKNLEKIQKIIEPYGKKWVIEKNYNSDKWQDTSSHSIDLNI